MTRRRLQVPNPSDDPALIPPPLTVGTALRQTHCALALAGIPEAPLEAEVLVRHVLGLDQAGLYLALESPWPAGFGEALSGLVQRRLLREPLAYILGQREFFGLTFRVTPAVMVPRPETETLVEEALRLARGRGGRLVIADVGTGSGCIAVSIAVHLPNATLYATDLSREALAVAQENTRRHDAAGQVHLLEGDLLARVPGEVDLLVANLPYIPAKEIDTLQPEIRAYEPRVALDGGPDGARLLRRLLEEAPAKLAARGAVLLEMDPRQRHALEAESRRCFPRATLCVLQDLAGQDRLLVIQQG